MRRLAHEFHVFALRKGQIGSVAGAALALTVAALAVIRGQRFTGNFITDHAAGASAGISFAHASSPSVGRFRTPDHGRRTSFRRLMIFVDWRSTSLPAGAAALGVRAR